VKGKIVLARYAALARIKPKWRPSTRHVIIIRSARYGTIE
jgi:hypothetical protein